MPVAADAIVQSTRNTPSIYISFLDRTNHPFSLHIRLTHSQYSYVITSAANNLSSYLSLGTQIPLSPTRGKEKKRTAKNAREASSILSFLSSFFHKEFDLLPPTSLFFSLLFSFPFCRRDTSLPFLPSVSDKQ